jgi:uncharacterized membrane protein
MRILIMDRVRESIDIQAPIQDCFKQWMKFEEFPSFMHHVKSITKLNNNLWHWVVDGPMGSKLEWDAEMEAVQPQYMISWKTVSDSAVKASGEVHFQEIDRNCTRVTSALIYQAPAGGLGEMVAKVFSNPDKMVKEDLENFKKLIEIKSPAAAAI